MKKLKEGDIFAIPISEELTGFGQIINIPISNGVFIIIVFSEIYSGEEWPALDEIIQDEILFFGYTMDALIYHKHWKIIGNVSSNTSKVKLPYYKFGLPPKMEIVNYKGEKVRNATNQEFDQLEYETSVAPIRYENALKAYHKIVEWDSDYEKLYYNNVAKSIEIVEGIEGEKKRKWFNLW
jgi:Immunity protein 26